jgi:hypothetical protein
MIVSNSPTFLCWTDAYMLRPSCLILARANQRMHHAVTQIDQLMHAPSICTISNSVLVVPIPHFSHRTALVSCCGAAEVPFSRPGVSCLTSSPSPPILRPQPALQAGGRCPPGCGEVRFLLLQASINWRSCQVQKRYP